MSADSSFWTLQLRDILSGLILVATIAAIIFGPRWAVTLSEERGQKRDRDRRRREILAALMRTRRYYMHPDHVFALNLIQLEFSENADVLEAYKSYINNLGDPNPQPGNALNNFLIRRNDLFFDMLHKMTTAVGLNIDLKELERFSYVPYGWETEQTETRGLRKALSQLLDGHRALPVVMRSGAAAGPGPAPVVPPQPGSGPFPPAP